MLAKEAEVAYPALVMSPTVERASVTIWSSGVAMDGDIYRPKDLDPSRPAPAVVLSHGWGGSKTTGERYAAKFAAAGMVSLCFTHCGWAASASHIVLAGERPDLDRNNEGVAKVRFIREVVDPVEWIENFRAAVDYIEGEPGVDPDRIGAWGTSFGGGVALHNAANDDRIKALAVQVAPLALRSGTLTVRGKQRAIDLARGRIAAGPQGVDGDVFPRLAGTPHLARFLQYDALAEAAKLQIPTLMMDASDEDLFDIMQNCAKAHEILRSKSSAAVDYKIIDGIDHYGIYFDGFDEGSERALAWFLEHL